MKVTLATVGRSYIFNLANELERLGCLERIYSGLPWSRLRREGVPRTKVKTFPFVRPFVMAERFVPFEVPERIVDNIHQFSLVTLDHYVARTLPDSDVYVGHEGVGLISGAEAKRRGMLYVCDRGCSHMAWQHGILQAEHERLGLPKRRRPASYQREIDEYETADLIVVPSEFARDSFLEKGIRPERLAVASFGVDLRRFAPVARPAETTFDVIFVGQLSVRKGIGDLLAAFRLANISNKRLTLIGEASADAKALYGKALGAADVVCLGSVDHTKLAELFSRSHVFCLPSIEDGWGMVVTEAMACSCPPIVSMNVGARSIVRSGENGYLVPIHAPEAIAANFERLAADRELRDRLGAAAFASVRSLGGWSTYGASVVAAYQSSLASRNAAA